MAIFFSLYSCSHPNSNHVDNIDPKFKRYLTSLNYIHLPFRYELGSLSLRDSSFLNSSPHFDTAGFSKYGIKGCIRPLGIIFNDSDNIVLADVSFADYYRLYPFLTSFDKRGNKLDSINPYQQEKFDSTMTTGVVCRITKGKRITIVDTTNSWRLKSNGKKFPGSLKISVDSTVYSVSTKGKFIKLSH